VRTISGTMTLHEELEAALAAFKHVEAVLTFQSGFTCNTGVIPVVAGEPDLIVSDQLNHASIIDGVRLCKARRYRYANNDMADLEKQLQQADQDGARFKLITTDGVFSMDGIIASLDKIHALADRREHQQPGPVAHAHPRQEIRHALPGAAPARQCLHLWRDPPHLRRWFGDRRCGLLERRDCAGHGHVLLGRRWLRDDLVWRCVGR
jgi:hypothetical protein